MTPTAPLDSPEPPPTRLLAGYIIDGITATRLSLKLEGLDPDNLPRTPQYTDFLTPPPGTYLLGDRELIRGSITEYLTGKGLDLDRAGVDLATIEVDGGFKTMIATQSCFLPYGFGGTGPEAKMGKREEYVRQWLERNGMLFLVSLLTCSHVIHRRQR